jgi:hypothetical protein
MAQGLYLVHETGAATCAPGGSDAAYQWGVTLHEERFSGARGGNSGAKRLTDTVSDSRPTAVSHWREACSRTPCCSSLDEVQAERCTIMWTSAERSRPGGAWPVYTVYTVCSSWRIRQRLSGRASVCRAAVTS